jgi:phage terminase large subunit
MILQFDTHGNEKQKLCARYWNDPVVTDIVYGGSKGSAKSYTGCSLIFGSGLIYPETHWFIARKKLNDLRKFTIPSIHEVFGHWKLNDNYYNYNGQDNYFDLYNKSRVYLLDAKYLPSDPLYQRFGSMQMTGGWIEEAGEFESASKQNLQASIGRWKNDVYGITGTLLQTCNPSHNYLYREYYKPFKEGALPDYRKFIQALPSDNKMLPAGYLENLNRILSKSDKERLLYGNWEYDDDPARLMSYEDILHVFDKREMPEERRMFITADIARFGSDLLVIGVWKGWELFEIHTMEKSRITEAP